MALTVEQLRQLEMIRVKADEVGSRIDTTMKEIERQKRYIQRRC
jgi:hypothetical protein